MSLTAMLCVYDKILIILMNIYLRSRIYIFIASRDL